MNGFGVLPPHIIRHIEHELVTEFATVSRDGIPIDTPTYCFPSDNLATIDLATGLAYPAKAERARRNPKVGLLIEGEPSDPVIAVRGRAAVRDSDFEANALRYIAETDYESLSFGKPWSVGRTAVWYWIRIIIEVTPERIMWWNNRESMNESPDVWSSPEGTVFPNSDPAVGAMSAAPGWPQRRWQDVARGAMDRKVGAHLTVCDGDGYPLPIRARSCEFDNEAFRLTIPRGAQWSNSGPATLTFQGMETFVGNVERDGEHYILKVERALPELPLVKNPAQVIQPDPVLRQQLMTRLENELARRKKTVPRIPEELPDPTRLANFRKARLSSMGRNSLSGEWKTA